MSDKPEGTRQVDSVLTDVPRTTLLLEYWKQSTLVQQHFNDISMKVRNFAVLIFSGFLTGVGISIHQAIYIEIFGIKVAGAFLFAIIGASVTLLIHFMDTYWYHVFLKSAVDSTLKIEKDLKKILEIEDLAGGIARGSQKVKVLLLFKYISLPIGVKSSYYSINRSFAKKKLLLVMKLYSYLFSSKTVDSTLRHKIFYRWLLVLILSTGLGSQFALKDTKNDSFDGNQIDRVYYISGNNVRLRATPEESQNILIQLQEGQVVKVIEVTKNSWTWVALQQDNDLYTGYIHKDFLKKIRK
jgi:hypothetical protein